MRKWMPVIAILSATLTSPASAEILTLYSDQGVPASTAQFPVITYAGLNIYPYSQWDGTSTLVTPPEGYNSFRTFETNPTFIGWGFDYGSAQNLSRFNTGQLRFWVNSTTGELEIQIKDSGGNVTFTKQLDTNLGWTNALSNQWVEYSIPFAGNLSGTGLSSVENPFLFTALTGPSTFYIDNVRYVDSTVSSPYFNVGLFNRADNSTANAITWSGAMAGSSWALADQYIQLTVDANTPSWGVQIYSDNTGSGASPLYTGVVSSSAPAGGLVNTSSTSVVLPMAWETMAVTSPTLVAQEPNSCPGNGLGCLWSYMQDAAVFTQGNLSVYNGAPFITVKNNLGIHYAQGTTLDATEFGAANPPNVIYLEANFNSALGNLSYKTSTLRVEFFTQ
jgi:hypothetical protein